MSDAGPPTPPPSVPPSPPPSLPAGWGSSPVGPPPSTPVDHANASTIAHPRAPRKRWLVVLIGAFVLIIGFAIAGTVLFVTNTMPPLNATIDFTNDLEDGRYASAYARLCDDLQAIVEPGDLESFGGSIGSNYVVNPLSVDRDGNHATVDFTVERFSGRTVKYELFLVHEDGDWKPCTDGGLFG